MIIFILKRAYYSQFQIKQIRYIPTQYWYKFFWRTVTTLTEAA